jgi:hypothetical protein
MDMDLRALAGKPACRTGVIEVDVSQQDVCDIPGGQALILEGLLKGGEGRAGSALDEHCAIGMTDQIRGDRMPASLEVQVKCDNTG